LNVIAQNANGLGCCLRECETKQEKRREAVERKPLSSGINGQHLLLTVFIQKSKWYNAGELLIVKALKTDSFIPGKKAEMGEM